MTAVIRSKASFGKVGQEHDFTGTRAVLLVSVGQRYHEGDKLQATIDLVNRSGIEHLTVAVADALQRHNYTDLPEDVAYAYALRAGDEWLERNSEILGGLLVPSDVLRWHTTLTDERYKALRERVENEYAGNPGYRAAVDATIGRFTDRLRQRDPDADVEAAFHRSWVYLMEECPVIMPLWAQDGHDFVIYPQPMTDAMAKTREIFVEPSHPDKARWLSLRFKKRALEPVA
ncbi:tRNA-dependent cyclodipeptide synthase [Actinomadura kijaniata]|uniref:tRNA-dependent cyclodipeptide synthase n=1 Tax=Actinomadura kijaniata TaxID=46161 RepID=UPI00082E072E|nr:tRNA-dependent cyclodipeptide synthase [Actinomadura kijaniata]